jgi:hypothetical protein
MGLKAKDPLNDSFHESFNGLDKDALSLYKLLLVKVIK